MALASRNVIAIPILAVVASAGLGAAVCNGLVGIAIDADRTSLRQLAVPFLRVVAKAGKGITGIIDLMVVGLAFHERASITARIGGAGIVTIPVADALVFLGGAGGVVDYASASAARCRTFVVVSEISPGGAATS